MRRDRQQARGKRRIGGGRAWRSGEVLDFEEYVRTRQDALLRSARRLVPDPVDAQDLLQTALVRTYGRWDGIADKSLADAYLRRVMINTRTEWWRARKLEEVPTEQLPGRERRRRHRAARRPRPADGHPEVLAPKQRSVVVLRHWEQMSTEETAAALGMSTGTVKSTLHRALARLRAGAGERDRAGCWSAASGAGAVRGLTRRTARGGTPGARSRRGPRAQERVPTAWPGASAQDARQSAAAAVGGRASRRRPVDRTGLRQAARPRRCGRRRPLAGAIRGRGRAQRGAPASPAPGAVHAPSPAATAATEGRRGRAAQGRPEGRPGVKSRPASRAPATSTRST